MTAIRSHHARVFADLLAERRRMVVDSLANGTATDYPAYRQMVGQIAGLDDAMKVSEEADFNINGEESDAGG